MIELCTRTDATQSRPYPLMPGGFLLEVGTSSSADKISPTPMRITDYYVASDAMGSVTAILDEDGNLLERRSYDAFGDMTCMLPDGTPVAISPTGLDVGFQGQIRDDATGLYQMGYRWLNPSLGRWLSRDPIGTEGGTNETSFCGNHPILATDPYGLMDIVGNTAPGMKCSEIDQDRYLQNAAQIQTPLALSDTTRKQCLPDVIRGKSASNVEDILLKYAQSKNVPIASFKVLVAFGHGSETLGQLGIIKYTSTTKLAAPDANKTKFPDGTPIALPFIIVPPQQAAQQIKTHISGCTYKPNAILLASCYGADGVAQAVANTTGLPVIATHGVVWCRQKGRNGSVRLYPVRRPFAGEEGKAYTQSMDAETNDPFGPITTTSTWTVIFPR
jgi:RHS repeat-associated protein